jgi:hypothetical protein
MTAKNKIWMFVGILLAVGLIVAGIIWVVKKNKKPSDPNNKPVGKPITLPSVPPPDTAPPQHDEDLATNERLPL